MTKLTISDWDGEEITIYEDHNRPRMRKDQTPPGEQQLTPEQVEKLRRSEANQRHLQDLYTEARKCQLRRWPVMPIRAGTPRRVRPTTAVLSGVGSPSQACSEF